MKINEDKLIDILHHSNLQRQLNDDKKSLYNCYCIKKSNGKKRVIYAPLNELKSLQYNLCQFILPFAVTKYAKAYEVGASTKKNALAHIGAKHILHIDIKDFFSSIDYKLFSKFFCSNLSDRTSDFFWEAVSYENGLPIGAPTSPFIANRVLYEIDKKLAKIKLFIKYTRYADDMIFSSRKPIKKEIITKIEKILNEIGLKINHQKTYFMSKRKEVTGILINSKQLSVGTTYKKQLKSEIYTYLTKGIGYPDIIRGKFSYLNFIEPKYAKKIKLKYQAIDHNNLFHNSNKHIT